MLQAMTFASRVTRSPRPFEPDRGAESRGAIPDTDEEIAGLIEGAGGSSPYLKTLIEKEAGWLHGALDNPEAAFDALLDELRDLTEDPAVPLRQAKRRVALLTGLADLAGVWPLEEVTGRLTRFADLAVQKALEHAIRREITRGKLPGASEADVPTGAGMTVLAMGKMGAAELNYSSDIDLICLFDEDRIDPDDYHEARAAFIRATRRMAATLNDQTGEGYVFRTDLRLRPDPAVTPVCMSMEAAERYYESLGRAWERAAYIKARPCAGDIAAGERFLQTLRPFVWRKHLDFAAVQDAHDMRLRIREHRGLHGPITLPGHNMKLGRGGIREIEFFTQTRQVIAGGRDPDLRVRGTVEGLQVLSSKGWIPQDVADTLSDNYRAFREVEHRVQMIHDSQTHDLPSSDEGFDRLAALMGRDRAELERDLVERLETVHQLIEGFFAPDDEACEEPDLPDPLENSELPGRWPSYPALRSQRATQIFRRLRPEILRRLGEAAKPEEALVAFDGFLQGLPAGVQLFSLFEANPHLIDLLVDIVSVSPDLARYLSRKSDVFDAVIAGEFFGSWPGREALERGLCERLEREAGDYERELDQARRWAREWHFRIGVHLLRGMMSPEEAGEAYADLASACVAGLWPRVQTEFARKHGPAPGRGAVVMGMGSLGAGRLHARSDLDLIVIYDPDGAEQSEGRKPLPVRLYYARLTQALVTAMTAPMAEGKLYEVDMRLRPSGNQGPVAASWEAFRNYHDREAWTWERMALTRARIIAGPEALAQDVADFRDGTLAVPRDSQDVLGDLAKMRARIAAAKGQGDPWDPKLGRGRMQDIELFAQACTLIAGRAVTGTRPALEVACEAGLVSEDGVEALLRAHDLAWALQIGARLVTDGRLDPAQLGSGGCAFLTRLTGSQDMEDLRARLETAAGEAGEIIDAALPAAREDEA